MNISISGLAGIKDAVIASGIKNFIEGMGFDIAVGVEGAATTGVSTAPAPPAEILPAPAPAPAAKTKRKYAKKQAAPAPKTRQKRAPKPAAISGGAEPRGTRRDAVRAALNSATGKNYYQLEAELKPVWPDLDRSMISTIVCQLAKGGECEQVDGKWRLCK